MNSSSKSVITFGELMLRLDCPTGQRFQEAGSLRSFFGGSEANVSVLLAQLGIPVRFISVLPENAIAQTAINRLRSVGVDTGFIQRSGDRMGIYYTEHGNSIRPSTVIYDRQHSSFAALTPGIIDWNKVFDGASIFHWSGISAALTQNALEVCKEAIQIAKQKGLMISADMNYRHTLWNYGKHPSEVMPELLSQCDIAIGDIDTVETYFGIKTPKDISIERKFQTCTDSLVKVLPSCQVLAMSFRGTNEAHQSTYRGALRMKEEIVYSPIYNLPQTIDRIGSGDAFMSGILAGFLKKQTAHQIILTAIACGAIKHSMKGDFLYTTEEEINSFIMNGPVDKIIR